MKKENFQQAKTNLNRNLRSLRNAIFSKTDLQEIVIKNLPNIGTNERLILRRQIYEYLWEKAKLQEVIFNFPSRKETRYLLGNIGELELAQSLKPHSYLSYRAAMFLHGLCDDRPKTIHINVEQSQYHKRNTNTLTQSSIDQAFKNKPRVSNEIAETNNIRVCVTHGQKTDRLGTEVMKRSDGSSLLVTSLERTLIDIIVRPIYAGGAKDVLEAYKRAENLSLDRLVALLKEMNYVYPYQQAIGFYLESTGRFKVADLAPLKELVLDFDFHLDYRIKNSNYSEYWKIHYPSDLL